MRIHISEQVKEVIDLLSKALKEHFDDYHGMYLYGSFADGSATADDDIELVAIFDVEDKQKREIMWPIVGKIETDLNVYIDLHPLTMQEFKKDQDFYNEVTENGLFFKD